MTKHAQGKLAEKIYFSHGFTFKEARHTKKMEKMEFFWGAKGEE